MAKNGQNLAIFAKIAIFEFFWPMSSKRWYKLIIFGLSASAAEAYGFTLVCPFVSHTPYLENRASGFDDFLHNANLNESKKMFQAVF